MRQQLGVIDRIAAAPWLDGLAGAVRDATHKALGPGRVKNVLHGSVTRCIRPSPSSRSVRS